MWLSRRIDARAYPEAGREQQSTRVVVVVGIIILGAVDVVVLAVLAGDLVVVLAIVAAAVVRAAIIVGRLRHGHRIFVLGRLSRDDSIIHELMFVFMLVLGLVLVLGLGLERVVVALALGPIDHRRVLGRVRLAAVAERHLLSTVDHLLNHVGHLEWLLV